MTKYLTKKGLAETEIKICDLVIKGKNNRKIASLLDMTEIDLKFSLQNIYKLLKVKSRSQLIVHLVPYLPRGKENEI